MKFHFYTRYVELYLCVGQIYDIRVDDWSKPGACIKFGRHVWHSNTGYKNIKKGLPRTNIGEPA